MKRSTVFGLMFLIVAFTASLDAFIWLAMEGLQSTYPAAAEVVQRADKVDALDRRQEFFHDRIQDLNRQTCNVFKQLVARGKMEANDPLFDDCK